MDKTIKIKSFKCDEDLSKYKNSILFNSGTVIAEGVFTYGDEELPITLDVFGETRIIYKGEVYTDPDDFPEELTNLIKEHPYDWDVCAPSGEGNDDEETYADSNNWFDYSVGSNGEDYPYEKDLSAASSLDILNDMLEIAQKFFFEKIEADNKVIDLTSQTTKEVLAARDEDGYVTGYVTLGFERIIDYGYDYLFDVLSEGLIGNTLLQNITYKIVNIDENNNITFEVTGYIDDSDIKEDE